MSGDSPSKLSRKGLNMKQNLADSYLVGKNLSKRENRVYQRDRCYYGS
jgi:hypothetical protein